MSVDIMAEEKFYTTAEVARALRVTERTVRKMINQGELDAFKVRDEFRIRQSAIDAYIRRQEARGEGQE